eukprot:scaffold11342_cov114-Isochrysis_galbana.AAC.7
MVERARDGQAANLAAGLEQMAINSNVAMGRVRASVDVDTLIWLLAAHNWQMMAGEARNLRHGEAAGAHALEMGIVSNSRNSLHGEGS